MQTAAAERKDICLQWLLIFSICGLVAWFIHAFYWHSYPGVVHTALEVACLFVAVTAFCVTWHTHHRLTALEHIIGFGFLAVACFDFWHTYYFPGLGHDPAGFLDLSIRFWILGRVTEAAVLYLATGGYFHRYFHKWTGLSIALLMPLLFWLTLLHFPGLFPVLLTERGVTPGKTMLEGLIIAVYLLGLYNLQNRVEKNEGILTYRYIYLALLLAVPAEMCFVSYTSWQSFAIVFGHMLKVARYYFLYQAIFVSAIQYPYKKLEEASKLEQSKLRQQEKLALVGEMAAGIIHEIKNPLTTIKGFSQMILSKTGEAKSKEYAAIINDAVDEATKAVSEFLAFAKPQPCVFKEIPLNNLIMSLEPMLETHSFIRGVNIQLQLMEENCTVKADENQLKQVIVNMVKNAVEAMGETVKPHLKIVTSYHPGTNEVSLTISDNGKGIAPQDLNRLGTPFFTTKEKGTGLGLSLCYQIIKEHQGRIEVESKIGTGTSFIITLPCCAAHSKFFLKAERPSVS